MSFSSSGQEIPNSSARFAHFGITVKTAKEDMDEYYDALDCEENCGCEECNVDDSEIIRELDRIKEAVMEQTGTNQCLVFVGSMENHVADRMEAYAKQNDLKVVETIFKDDRAID